MGAEADKRSSPVDDFHRLPDSNNEGDIKLDNLGPETQGQDAQLIQQAFVTGPKLGLILAALYATMFLVALVRLSPLLLRFNVTF